MAKPEPDLMERVVSLCKRRGFVFQSSEIYGGINSCYDYGPLGAELKRNVKDAWWQAMVVRRDDIVGLDSAIIQHPEVWRSSGHVAGFSDLLVDCRRCKGRFREDHLDAIPCPDREFKGRVARVCQQEGLHTEPRAFNLMFETHAGPVKDSASIVYLRPETAQGIFTNFLNVVNSSRMAPPFGVAQIGKSFRNEITPGNFVFRTREFEQMEMEFFVPPADEDRWYEYWVEQRFRWYVDNGVRPDRLRKRPHAEDELAHYSSGCTDVEYLYPFGWGELEGIAKRGSYDLTAHAKGCGKDLSFFDEATKQRYVPHVVEPAAGCDRAAMTFLVDAYDEETVTDEGGKSEVRTVLHFHPRIAPITVAIFPLVKKAGMPERAKEIQATLMDAGLRTFFDEKGAIGRRYRRQDEVGTPYCVTIDGDTVERDGTVTVRDRDSMAQDRVQPAELVAFIRDKMKAWRRG
ncbi:MAG: glycine--tRNA ligase [Planctomycetes bacterium]|nr:glycine--tRNA ligase [Planctomycetota bacterium]